MIAKNKRTFGNKTAKMLKCFTKFSGILECGAGHRCCGLIASFPEPCASSGGRLPEAFFLVLRFESQVAKMYKSCRSRQELSKKYFVFTCKCWRRYSRERASQSLPKISRKLEKNRENIELGHGDGEGKRQHVEQLLVVDVVHYAQAIPQREVARGHKCLTPFALHLRLNKHLRLKRSLIGLASQNFFEPLLNLLCRNFQNILKNIS